MISHLKYSTFLTDKSIAIKDNHTNKTITVAETNLKEELNSLWEVTNCLLQNDSLIIKRYERQQVLSPQFSCKIFKYMKNLSKFLKDLSISV
jgi:hypothetical protein